MSAKLSSALRSAQERPHLGANLWRQLRERSSYPPFGVKGYPDFRCYLRSAYHLTEHLVSMSAWNSPSCTGTLSKSYLSACDALWTTTHKHSWSELLPVILPLASAGLTRAILALNHMLVTAIIWVKKKYFQSTNWNEFKPHVTVSCSLYASLTLAQTHCTCHRYFVNTISNTF